MQVPKIFAFQRDKCIFRYDSKSSSYKNSNCHQNRKNIFIEVIERIKDEGSKYIESVTQINFTFNHSFKEYFKYDLKYFSL